MFKPLSCSAFPGIKSDLVENYCFTMNALYKVNRSETLEYLYDNVRLCLYHFKNFLEQGCLLRVPLGKSDNWEFASLHSSMVLEQRHRNSM